MPILNTNDDLKILSVKTKIPQVAMSTLRGDMYRIDGKNNQDAVATFTKEFPWGTLMVDMVCDGLGGYADQNGELAARFCCEEMEKIMDQLSQKREPRELLKILLQNTVQRYEQEHLGPDAGTTLLLIFTLGNEIVTYHLGDSRAMFFRPNGEFVAQTRDHKPPEPEHRFKLTRYVYQTDPDKLFSQADELRISESEHPEGLIAILMSDGITDNLKTSAETPECQTSLSHLVQEHQDAETLCRAIMKTANERMALKGTETGKTLDVKPDNSACLVRVYRPSTFRPA